MIFELSCSYTQPFGVRAWRLVAVNRGQDVVVGQCGIGQNSEKLLGSSVSIAGYAIVSRRERPKIGALNGATSR
jgi:hypothetical protein